ncbi:hypothetical protein D9M70_514610 [compost metagenome]
MLIEDVPLASFSTTLCESIAWLMTSSPTRLIRRSTRSRSTRMVGVPADAAACWAAALWAALAAGAALSAGARAADCAICNTLLAVPAAETAALRMSCCCVANCSSSSTSPTEIAGSSSRIDRSKGTGCIGSSSPDCAASSSSSVISRSQSHSANSKTVRIASSPLSVASWIFQEK